MAKVGHLSISLLTLDFILFRSELLDEGYRGDLFVFDCTFLFVCVCVCLCVAMCVGRKWMMIRSGLVILYYLKVLT